MSIEYRKEDHDAIKTALDLNGKAFATTCSIMAVVDQESADAIRSILKKQRDVLMASDEKHEKSRSSYLESIQTATAS